MIDYTDYPGEGGDIVRVHQGEQYVFVVRMFSPQLPGRYSPTFTTGQYRNFIKSEAKRLGV